MKKNGIAVLFTIFISMLIPAFAEDNFIRGTSGWEKRNTESCISSMME